MSKFSNFLATFIIIFCFFSATVVRSAEYTSFPLSLVNASVSPCGGGGQTNNPVNCPVSCFRTDPVCGVDGVTYWCGCADAVCAGAEVARLGFCEVGDGVNGSQALLLIHIVWLILLGFFVVFGHL
ncbi:Serine protease inhibitor, Kazal-type family protein [Heracleum sosnowskyi]|uniref:Serine protease inhibitor, Kazal-type family protein n=1 Tax=Heracleum sosnowskyi TaxID=360622 RepID=A0AAD8J8S5_9APIA|nr:Serine protease inhibitor, Kazal-type family protein [Heracleum sosnowskyi]